MSSHRLLTLGPDHEPRWVRLYEQPIGERWVAMLVADADSPPDPGTVKGMAFFGETPEEPEERAEAYLGMGEPRN
jgi:hypothetical protein